MPGAQAQDKRRPRRRRDVDADREQRLVDGDLHSLPVGDLGLVAKSPVLVLLAAIADDQTQHLHRLVGDRHHVHLELANRAQPGDDALAVHADLVVEERHDGKRRERDLPVDQHRDHEHAEQRDGALHDRRGRAHAEALGGLVDLVHQRPGLLLLVEGETQPLEMLEEDAHEIEHHPELELGVDVTIQKRRRPLEHRQHEERSDGEDQHRGLAVADHAVREISEAGRALVAAEHLVEDEAIGHGCASVNTAVSTVSVIDRATSFQYGLACGITFGTVSTQSSHDPT